MPRELSQQKFELYQGFGSNPYKSVCRLELITQFIDWIKHQKPDTTTLNVMTLPGSAFTFERMLTAAAAYADINKVNFDCFEMDPATFNAARTIVPINANFMCGKYQDLAIKGSYDFVFTDLCSCVDRDLQNVRDAISVAVRPNKEPSFLVMTFYTGWADHQLRLERLPGVTTNPSLSNKQVIETIVDHLVQETGSTCANIYSMQYTGGNRTLKHIWKAPMVTVGVLINAGSYLPKRISDRRIGQKGKQQYVLPPVVQVLTSRPTTVSNDPDAIRPNWILSPRSAKRRANEAQFLKFLAESSEQLDLLGYAGVAKKLGINTQTVRDKCLKRGLKPNRLLDPTIAAFRATREQVLKFLAESPEQLDLLGYSGVAKKLGIPVFAVRNACVRRGLLSKCPHHTGRRPTATVRILKYIAKHPESLEERSDVDLGSELKVSTEVITSVRHNYDALVSKYRKYLE